MQTLTGSKAELEQMRMHRQSSQANGNRSNLLMQYQKEGATRQGPHQSLVHNRRTPSESPVLQAEATHSLYHSTSNDDDEEDFNTMAGDSNGFYTIQHGQRNHRTGRMTPYKRSPSAKSVRSGRSKKSGKNMRGKSNGRRGNSRSRSSRGSRRSTAKR